MKTSRIHDRVASATLGVSSNPNGPKLTQNGPKDYGKTILNYSFFTTNRVSTCVDLKGGDPGGYSMEDSNFFNIIVEFKKKSPPLETQYDSSDPTLKKNSESANDACAVDGMFCLIMQYSYNACFISNISWSEN